MEVTLFGMLLVIVAINMIGCAGFHWLKGRFGMECTLFGMLLVVVVTNMIGRAGF